uniref:RHD domain-containing protein n=1 Tax=Periophthalmus magnuspinnatus TaxID=409849 RepID=A0A3B4AV72_9GOBI
MQEAFCLSVHSSFSFGSAAAAAGSDRGLDFLHSVSSEMKSAEEDAYSYTPNVSLSLPLGMGNPCLATQYHTLQTSPIISVTSCHQTAYSLQNDNHNPGSTYYLPHGIRPNGAPALESPRIEITAYSHYPEDEVEESNSEDHIIKRGVNSIVTLTLPNAAEGYRDPTCLSPASSISSRSCNSEASSYESSFYNYDNSPQNSPWQSPCVSPRNSLLPNSPSSTGARKYSLNGNTYRQTSPNQSPIPSPHGSPRVSVTDENWIANTNQYTNSAIVAAINALTTDGVVDMGEGIPIKTRKTMLEHQASMGLKVEPSGEDLSPEGDLCHDEYASRLALKKESYCGGFLDVPQHPYSWSKPKPYLSPSLPSLDWQLPSCSGPYSLQIEVQPKSHHRAHYETEGSRGAVKALSGGHPVVQLYGYMESEPLTLQLFIGTADDRLLRPHAFYQVHRITGKTVSTASHEVMQSNTKILEIPLLPENNMRAIIDCAGILKLRNSDIELRKGETDIGRKNTRVRLVFRVHINQPNGRTVSLQASSNPIECSQRSAQELPLVEKQSVDSYPATGGKMMLVSGLNFLPDSKVVFVEKAQGKSLQLQLLRNPTKTSSTLVVEIPPYRNQRISSPVQVNFYICNGKRKRSQYQRFTYLPPNVPIIKTEPNDEYDSMGSGLPIHSQSFYSPPRLTPVLPVPDSEACMVGTYPCPPRHTTITPSPPSSSPTLHDLTPLAYNKCLPSSPTHGPLLSSIHENANNLNHPASPDHSSSLTMLQSQGSPNHHLNSPGPHGYSHIYPSSSPSSSPVSHPSTPGGPAESPFGPVSSQNGENSPTLLHEDSSSSSIPVTIKQEPQELDQMYLDDGECQNKLLWVHCFLVV